MRLHRALIALLVVVIGGMLFAPLIHAVFSFFFGWKEYMPFIPIPSMWKLL